MRAQQFTQTDPMPYGAGSAFESAYAYAMSNPLMYIDPSGLRGEKPKKFSVGFGGQRGSIIKNLRLWGVDGSRLSDADLVRTYLRTVGVRLPRSAWSELDSYDRSRLTGVFNSNLNEMQRLVERKACKANAALELACSLDQAARAIMVNNADKVSTWAGRASIPLYGGSLLFPPLFKVAQVASGVAAAGGWRNACRWTGDRDPLRCGERWDQLVFGWCHNGHVGCNQRGA